MKGKIRKKWTLTVVILVTVAFLLVSLSSVFYFFRNLIEQTIFSEQQKLEQIRNQLRYVQREVETLVKQLVVDTEFVNYILQDEEGDIFRQLVKSDNLRKVLQRFSNLNQDYYSINVVTDSGKVYSSNPYEGEFDQEAVWYKKIFEDQADRGFSMAHLIARPQVSKLEEAVSYINPYHVIRNDQKKNGYVIVNFGLNRMVNLEKAVGTLQSGCVLYDKHGNILLSSGELTASYEEISRCSAGDSMVLQNQNIILRSNFLEDGWILTAEVSNNQMLRETFPMILMLIILYSIVLVVLAVILIFFIGGYTRPIEKLHQAAVSVREGNLKTYVDIHTGDELELLGSTFNQMIDSINSYILQLVEHEKVKKEMELERLMLQINPHFIYNTLNTIVYMAQIKGHEDIIQYTNAFISLLQDTLQVEGNGPLVKLEFEIKNIQKYLLLMSYRYPNQFQVEYDVDNKVLDCAVPNVMLQPMVENAIFHGLAVKKQPGILKIIVKADTEDVWIEVLDNGFGMSEEVIKKVLSEGEENRGTMRKIGIANVKKRLEALYGEPYGLKIESKVGHGTKISIRVPYSKTEDNFI